MLMRNVFEISRKKYCRIPLIVLTFLLIFVMHDLIIMHNENQVFAKNRNDAYRYCKGREKCPRYTKKSAAIKGIKKAVKNRKKTFSFYYKSNSPKKASYFTKGLFYVIDGIECTKSVNVYYYYYSGKWNVKNSVCYYYRLYFRYNYTPKQEKKLKKAIYEVADSLYGDSDEKVRQFDDYMIENCDYDYDLYYGKDKSTNNHTNGYSVYSALMKGKAVCNGYAETATAVLKVAGVDVEFVDGQGGGEDNQDWGGHAWNIVKVGDKWYSCDFCWDSCRKESVYLLKGTKNKYFWSKHKLGNKYTTKSWGKKHPMAKEDLDVEDTDVVQ